MTSQILISELGNLIQESKRKLPDLRHAAESSLQELKALPTTSEKQIAADLSKRPQFINPFLIACSSRNVKFAAIGTACFHKLAVSQALPRTRLKDVLDAITECASLGLDIQLKILQTLPALLQNYAEEVKGASLFTVLQICSTLQASKTPSVSSTAAATLQQLVTSLYERLAAEDGRILEIPTVAEVPIETGQVPVRSVAHDAFRVFQDVCLLIEGSKPRYVRFSPTPEASLLELIESILTGHAAIIKSHPEQAHLVRSILLPHLIKTFSEKTAFPIAVRVTRLLYLVVKNHIDQFPSETETILQWFNHSLDPEATLLWKRILCMEVFREIFTDSNLVLRIHSKFDGQEDRNAVIPNCLTAFVRLATEKPALIGLSQQSTVPIGHYFQRDSGADASADSAMTPGASGGAAGVPTSAVPGISAQFSSVRTPCIEQLDKTEPPNAPETYIYSLVLASLNNLAESLAKFILPLTVHSGEKVKKRTKPGHSEVDSKSADKISEDLQQDFPDSEFQRSRGLKKRTVPVNPLTLNSHPSFAYIQSTADLIDKSWHAILASCSTLFYAALDSENYRSLVRSFQKFTQVAGLLSMTTPRDAFLTTLGKSAMPPNLLTAGISSAGSQAPQTPSFLSNAKGLLSVDNIVNQASSFLPDRRRSSIDSGEPTLNVRNLLCLRALLNLAIALGPTLENSWSIIVETLQLADKVLAGTGGRPLSRDPRSSTLPLVQTTSTEGSYTQQMSSEITAVQSAGSRLFESTADFPNEAFVHVLKALCSLVDDRNVPPGTSGPASPPTPGHQRRIASFSGLSIKTGIQEHDFLFTLSKVRELASLNLERFLNNEPAESGWDIVTTELTAIATKTSVSPTARLLAVDLIRHLVLDTISFPFEADEERESEVQKRALNVLTTISSILQEEGSKAGSLGLDETNIEVHNIVIETLRGLLEHSGESLTGGWPAVFEVISSAFRNPLPLASGSQVYEASSQVGLLSVVLGRSAFNSIQLVCSDFLTPMLDSSLPALTDLLFQFGSQEQDLNISLTTTTFFWNVSDFLYGRISQSALDRLGDQSAGGNSDQKPFPTLHHVDNHDYIPFAWLSLLRRLTDMTADSRDEVRNGAVHTTLRIFDNHGDDLSPNVWQLCLKTILLRMVETDVRTQTELHAEREQTEDWDEMSLLKGKIGTSQIILEGMSKLFASYLDPIAKAPNFAHLWRLLADSFAKYGECDVYDLSAAVYSAITQILSKVPDAQAIGTAEIERISMIWDKQFPDAKPHLPSSSNLKAFEAYATSLKDIYRLRRSEVTAADSLKITENLERCIRESDSPSYSSDLDSLTTLQSRVVECLYMLRSDIDGATSIKIALLARFIGLPFEAAQSDKPTNLTFIALSKASMDLLQTLTEQNAAWQEIFGSGTLLSALSNIERTISLKYQWPRQGRNPPLWRKAASTSLAVLEHAIPRMFEMELDQSTIRAYWEVIVRIARNIAHADREAIVPVPDPVVSEDEDFDVTSLTSLSGLIIPALGSQLIPDSTKRAYTRALFTASVIHAPEHEEVLDIDNEPLNKLYNIRFGRTYDPEPTAREKMSYFCFRELVSLLRVQESSPAQIKLAKAAAPYVILRVALPLKAYIADQPLRGKLPMPESQKLELIRILGELREVRCEPAAIPDADGVKSNEGGHLVRLFPLVVKASEINGDEKVKHELVKWLNKLGGEFGL